MPDEAAIEEWYRTVARRNYVEGSSNSIEIDTDAVVSIGDDGAFVQAWVWVLAPEIDDEDDDTGCGCGENCDRSPGDPCPLEEEGGA